MKWYQEKKKEENIVKDVHTQSGFAPVLYF